jgi:hypothetical protein
MKCNDPSSATRACPKELEGKSPFEACKIVEAKKKSIEDRVVDIFNPLGVIADAAGSKNEAITNIINETGISIDTKQLTESLAACDIQVKIEQSNLVDTRECDAQFAAQKMTLIGYLNAATERKDYEGAAFIQKAITNLTDARQTGTIDQSNDAELTVKCKVNALLSVLAKADVTVANTAMMDLLQKASGPMTSNESNTNVCNKTFVKQTGCQYLSNKSCCMVEFEGKQSNVKLGCPQGGHQTNRFVANMSCDAGATSEAKVETGTSVKNKAEVKISQEATMSSSASSGSIFCVCLCLCLFVCIGIAVFLYASSTEGDENPAIPIKLRGNIFKNKRIPTAVPLLTPPSGVETRAETTQRLLPALQSRNRVGSGQARFEPINYRDQHRHR